MNKFKIYYEDPDASGRVYHANYLKFLERGRSDLIYKTKYTHEQLLKKFGIFFVVKECKIYFNKPAFFEDTVEVISLIKELTKVKINFTQKIYRESDLLVEAKVLVVPISQSGKILRLPDQIYNLLTIQKN